MVDEGGEGVFFFFFFFWQAHDTVVSAGKRGGGWKLTKSSSAVGEEGFFSADISSSDIRGWEAGLELVLTRAGSRKGLRESGR